MAAKNVILTLLALCGMAYGQTRSLLVDTSGVVQYTNTVQWQGALSFGTNATAQAITRSNLSLGLSALTNTTGAGLLADIGGMTTNGDAAGLTNFPSVLLRTNGSASALTNFPAELLRTNGNAAALTNFPSSLLRTNGDGSGLTNLPNNAGSFTNFPAELLRTNGNAIALTNFPAELLRTNGDGTGLSGVAIYPAFSNKAAMVLAVTTNETGVEWIAVSNATTDAALLTNFPSLLLRTNGSASALTNFPAELLRTNGDGAGLTNLTASNITGTVALASNVSGVVGLANGGTGAEDATNALINLLPSYSGNANRVLALNSNATSVVWAVDSGGTANLTNVTNTLAISNGGTGATNAGGALTNFGILVDGGAGVVGVSIGASQTFTGSSSAVAIGNNAFMSNSANSVSIGQNARSDRGSKNVAIGNSAIISNVANSVQLGEGLNNVSSTIQFLSAGTVNTTEWGYLANASTRGGYAMTNTAAISTNISVTGTTNTNTLVFSNGILINVTSP